MFELTFKVTELTNFLQFLCSSIANDYEKELVLIKSKGNKAAGFC